MPQGGHTSLSNFETQQHAQNTATQQQPAKPHLDVWGTMRARLLQTRWRGGRSSAAARNVSESLYSSPTPLAP